MAVSQIAGMSDLQQDENNEWPQLTASRGSNSQQTNDTKRAEKSPNPNETCASCDDKMCYVVVGSGRNQKKQKSEFKWIECDVCQSWYHSTCQALKPSEVTTITKLASKGVKWFCSNCTDMTQQDQPASVIPQMSKLGNLEKMITSIDAKLDNYCKKSDIQIENLKKSWAEVTNEGQLAKNMKLALQASTSTNAMISAELEKKQTEERKTSAILYGLHEQKTAMEDVENMMNKDLFKNFDKPITAFRLGQKADSRIRPIKLKFRDENEKWNFLKRANALRAEQIFCKLDVNKETRDKEYKLREQIRGLRTDNGSTQYRIRDLKIQQKIESGNWEDMKTVMPTEIHQGNH